MKKNILLIVWVLFSTTAWASERILAGLGEIKGTTKGYKITNGDGLADFSLVIPGMNAEEIANFDMGRIFSPESDTIKVFSYSLDLPSNLSVPKQTESYFLSFTLEKNTFRAYLPSGKDFNMYAIRGQFPVSDVVKGVQNKQTLFEIVNFFKFYGGGIQIAKANGNSNLEININDVAFDSNFSLKAPTYPNGNVLLTIGMVKSNGEYFPTDVKRIPSGKTEKIITSTNTQQYALSILLNDHQRAFMNEPSTNITESLLSYFEPRATTDFTQLSYNLQKVSTATSPTLLDQIAPPQFNKVNGKLTALEPKEVKGITPYATQIVLSEREAGTGIVPVSFKQVLWSEIIAGWQNNYTLPAEALNLIKNKSYSLEIMYLGTDNTPITGFSWENVTHVTRNGIIL